MARLAQLGVVGVLAATTYLTGLGFSLGSTVQSPLNPLYMVLHILLLPATLCAALALALAAARDAHSSSPPSALASLGVLAALCAALLSVMTTAARADVFSCFLLGCSIANHPLPRATHSSRASHSSSSGRGGGQYTPAEAPAVPRDGYPKGNFDEDTARLIAAAAPSWGGEATTNTMVWPDSAQRNVYMFIYTAPSRLHSQTETHLLPCQTPSHT